MNFTEASDESKSNELCSQIQALHQKHGFNANVEMCNELYDSYFPPGESLVVNDKKLKKTANLIRNAVVGFSDYRGEYACLGHFLSRGIECGTADTALSCVKACECMYKTHEVEEFYDEEWAVTTIQRVLRCIHMDAATTSVGEVMIGCKMLALVYEAGSPYESLVQSHTELREVLRLTAEYIEGTNILAQCSITSKQLNLLKRDVSHAQGMCASGAEKLSLLESSIDLTDFKMKAVGNALFTAYNSMCEHQEADLELQLAAVNGSLTAAALFILERYTEETESKAFLEACVFVNLLFTPWDRENSAHMDKKLTIATKLKQAGILVLLTRQFEFWWLQWTGNHGDCFDPLIMALKEYLLYFPDEVGSVKGNISIVSLIRQSAEARRTYEARHKRMHTRV